MLLSRLVESAASLIGGHEAGRNVVSIFVRSGTEYPPLEASVNTASGKLAPAFNCP
jgi:hypothetical protein